MSDKERLLKKIQICDFALFDVHLYLDTHPTDKEALAYYSKHKKMREEFANEYTDKFGPLIAMDSKNPDKWEWVNGPWPWECKSEVK